MRFDCGPTHEEKEAGRKLWHHWFAWFPVRVSPRECVWLETVERKGEYLYFSDLCGGVFGSWVYEYRSID